MQARDGTASESCPGVKQRGSLGAVATAAGRAKGSEQREQTLRAAQGDMGWGSGREAQGPALGGQRAQVWGCGDVEEGGREQALRAEGEL